MSALAPAIGVLIVAAITPGPNNFLVLNAAMRGGLKAATRIGVAIITGSLVLFTLFLIGFDTLDARFPALRQIAAAAGAAYLAWLGLSLARAARSELPEEPKSEPISATGTAFFQLLNPKGWVLMAVFTATGAEVPPALLAGSLIVVLVSCLSLWALAGHALTSLYAKPGPRVWIDRAMGLALVIFALLIAGQAVSLHFA